MLVGYAMPGSLKRKQRHKMGAERSDGPVSPFYSTDEDARQLKKEAETTKGSRKERPYFYSTEEVKGWGEEETEGGSVTREQERKSDTRDLVGRERTDHVSPQFCWAYA